MTHYHCEDCEYTTDDAEMAEQHTRETDHLVEECELPDHEEETNA